MPAITIDTKPPSGEIIMQLKALLASIRLVGALGWLTVVLAPAQIPAALSGQVSSVEEGAMEGVLVIARKDGATVTTTVVTGMTETG
jgi:hypothetical protein